MDFSWFLQELVGEAASIKCGFPQTGNGKHSQWASDTWRLPSLKPSLVPGESKQ